MIIDEIRLKQIENRLDSITSEKWCYKAGDEYEDHFISTEDGTYIAQTTYDTLSSSMLHNVEADSMFIANAPDDIRFLIETIKGLMK